MTDPNALTRDDTNSSSEIHSPLSHDILRGAEQIAAYLFGDAKLRRKIYHLAQTGNLPVFRLGSTLCARKSKLLHWIEEEEERSRHVRENSE